MKVLIADDDSVIRTLVYRVTMSLSGDILQAENGLEALGIIEREDPDLLITDLRMPVLDGFELIDAIRSSAPHAGLAVVCLSSVSDRDDIVRLAKLGVVDYVLKPVRPADLLERIRNVTPRALSWKANRDRPVISASTPRMLVVDPDPAFRALVVAAFGQSFAVIEAASGAEALNTCRHTEQMPTVAFIADGLRLLDEQRTARLLKQVAADRGAEPPRVILVSDNAVDAQSHGAEFDGMVARLRTAEELATAVAQWVPATEAQAVG
jgi:two-component system cell cycle response regulator